MKERYENQEMEIIKINAADVFLRAPSVVVALVEV